MTASPSSPLSPLKKALLLAAGGCAFATPVAAGLLTTPEAQNAVARATAMASSALGAPASKAAPDNEPAKPIVLARNEAVLAPALSVTKVDAAPTALSQDVAAPRIATPPPAATPQPVQLAVASPAPPKPSAIAALPVDAAEAKKQAADFVKAYAASTPFHTIGRWAGSICVNVSGLSYEQGAAVRDRVDEVADGLGLTALGPACNRYNVEIGFTNDPQAALDTAIKASKINPLGDRTSDTRSAKTVTLPIQAWYVTNGELYAQNDAKTGAGDANSLKVRVLYQPPNSAGAWPYFPLGLHQSVARERPRRRLPYIPAGSGGRFVRGQGVSPMSSVIVDLRKTGSRNLGELADYAAMLALSEPRALGQCNALPSITDLFAACPSRSAPDGLTPADTAYLTALYTAQGAVLGASHQSHVIQQMADVLVNGVGTADAIPAKKSAQPTGGTWLGSIADGPGIR